MPRPAEARAWWAEVEDVKERIELRRAREGEPARRGVRVVKAGASLTLVRPEVPSSEATRRRPRPRVAQRVGADPDRIAAWAVALGVLLLLAAILSAH